MVFRRIRDLAEQILTPEGYKLFELVNSKLPDIWNRPTASTLKYHKRADGTVPSIGEHAYEMVLAASKIIPMFGRSNVNNQNDAILIAILFHDSLKYGKTGKNPHTTRNHEQEMADLCIKNKKVFLKHFTEEEFHIMEQCIRFHSGKWSPDAKKMKDFKFEDLPKECMFVHMFDMLSTKSCLVEN